MVIFEGHDEFLGLIPRTILIQHYVSLRILLKQLVAHVLCTKLEDSRLCKSNLISTSFTVLSFWFDITDGA